MQTIGNTKIMKGECVVEPFFFSSDESHQEMMSYINCIISALKLIFTVSYYDYQNSQSMLSKLEARYLKHLPLTLQ